MAQSFGRDGSLASAALHHEVLAYRIQAAALGDLDKATVRSIRASHRDAIDFVGSPFKPRKPSTRDGIGTVKLAGVRAGC